MELKEWTYEEFPEFTDEVEGVLAIPTTGNEIGVDYLPDVEYARIDGVTLHLQILLPTSRNYPEMICPCVVYVKGSAWMEQDVYEHLPTFAKLAERGYVMVIVEYRHSGIAPFPAQIMDARNAVRFMRKNAGLYHVDPDNIVIAGDSSGGHTAMFAGMLQDRKEDKDKMYSGIRQNHEVDNLYSGMLWEDAAHNLYPGVSASVKGIVNYYGSTSVMADDSNPITVNHCRADSPEGMLMGHIDFHDNEALKRKISVECNITEDTEVPPTLIFHGTKDRTVNCEGSVILYRQMKKCGKDVTLYLLKGADHGGPEFWSSEVLDIVDSFIQKCIG